MNRFKELAGRLNDPYRWPDYFDLNERHDTILSALDLAASVEGSGDKFVEQLRGTIDVVSEVFASMQTSTPSGRPMDPDPIHVAIVTTLTAAASRLAAQEVEIKALKHDLDRCITREHEALNVTLAAQDGREKKLLEAIDYIEVELLPARQTGNIAASGKRILNCIENLRATLTKDKP